MYPRHGTDFSQAEVNAQWALKAILCSVDIDLGISPARRQEPKVRRKEQVSPPLEKEIPAVLQLICMSDVLSIFGEATQVHRLIMLSQDLQDTVQKGSRLACCEDRCIDTILPSEAGVVRRL